MPAEPAVGDLTHDDLRLWSMEPDVRQARIGLTPPPGSPIVLISAGHVLGKGRSPPTHMARYLCGATHTRTECLHATQGFGWNLHRNGSPPGLLLPGARPSGTLRRSRWPGRSAQHWKTL